jgi:hypothetical protein
MAELPQRVGGVDASQWPRRANLRLEIRVRRASRLHSAASLGDLASLPAQYFGSALERFSAASISNPGAIEASVPAST